MRPSWHAGHWRCFQSWYQGLWSQRPSFGRPGWARQQLCLKPHLHHLKLAPQEQQSAARLQRAAMPEAEEAPEAHACPAPLASCSIEKSGEADLIVMWALGGAISARKTAALRQVLWRSAWSAVGGACTWRSWFKRAASGLQQGRDSRRQTGGLTHVPKHRRVGAPVQEVAVSGGGQQ